MGSKTAAAALVSEAEAALRRDSSVSARESAFVLSRRRTAAGGATMNRCLPRESVR